MDVNEFPQGNKDNINKAEIIALKTNLYPLPVSSNSVQVRLENAINALGSYIVEIKQSLAEAIEYANIIDKLLTGKYSPPEDINEFRSELRNAKYEISQLREGLSHLEKELGLRTSIVVFDEEDND